MKKKKNFAAIVAVVMVTFGTMWLTSCTADDEYGNFEFDTLAEGLVTRSEGLDLGESESQINVFGHPVSFPNVMFINKDINDTLSTTTVKCRLTYSEVDNKKELAFFECNELTLKEFSICDNPTIRKRINNNNIVEVKAIIIAKHCFNDSIYTAELNGNFSLR